jgi:YHS domain-containing protein
MKTIHHAVLFIIFSALTATAFAGGAMNVDSNGIGIQGYDPVAFFTDGKPILGQEQFHSSYHDVTYRFASAEHQQMFEKDPAKYEPQFGGYCAYGVTQGHLAPIKVDAFEIVDGRLLMGYDANARTAFDKDQAGNLKIADHNWPGLAEQKK